MIRAILRSPVTIWSYRAHKKSESELIQGGDSGKVLGSQSFAHLTCS